MKHNLEESVCDPALVTLLESATKAAAESEPKLKEPTPDPNTKQPKIITPRKLDPKPQEGEGGGKPAKSGSERSKNSKGIKEVEEEKQSADRKAESSEGENDAEWMTSEE